MVQHGTAPERISRQEMDKEAERVFVEDCFEILGELESIGLEAVNAASETGVLTDID